jgi:hypothetical protein
VKSVGLCADFLSPVPVLQLEERDRAMLELLADDAFRAQTEAVAVEPHRLLQIIDAERQQRDSRFQVPSPRGGSPGPCSRAIKSSSQSDSFPSSRTRVDFKGLVQLHACG